MSATSSLTTVIGDALGQPSLSHAFLAVAAANAAAPALGEHGSDRSLTYGQWRDEARRVAGGLRELGVGRGDRVGLLLGTRLEFHVVDMGVLLAAGVPYSMYATAPVAQLAPCVENAAPRVVITERSLAERARELQAACPVIEHVIVLEDDLAALQDRCPPDFDVHAAIADVGGDDLCSLVYTSGTTGAPKGVPYLHRCLMKTMDSINRHVPVSPDGRVISYLPMAHIAERMFGHYAGSVFGCHITSLPDPAQLGAALRDVRPTRFFGVPRIWEKLLSGLHRAVAGMDDGAAVTAAWEAGIARVEAEQAGRATDPVDTSALAGLPRLLGLDAAEWLGVAGAPAGRDTLVALHAVGLPVKELYGMSETIVVSTSPPDRVRIGTCGVPLPGVEIRTAPDGEILVAGVTVMPGYFEDPARTAEVLIDGWMHTGDVGVIDDAGFLTITDRKKALIINSAGKNMSPAAIEQAIKGGQPLIAQVVAIGDRRPYNVALIVLDRDGLETLRAGLGIAETDFATLSRDERIRATVEQIVRAGNQRLARVEQIKRHHVLDHDWAPASEQLTPTAKLKRKAIAELYADTITELYA